MHAFLEADAQQVALNLAQVQVDVHSLRALLADATVDSLQAARELGAPTLLEGFDAHSGAFEEWVAAERRRLRRDLAAAATPWPRSAAKPATRTVKSTRSTGYSPLSRSRKARTANSWPVTRAPVATRRHSAIPALRTVLRRELDLAPDPATEALYRD